MNVLFSSVGRRSYLVRYFREALGGQGRVIAANSIMDTPSMRSADRAYCVPNASSKEYISRILEICKDEEVGLVFSLHDWEAPFLAGNMEVFLSVGVRPIISSPEVIDICLNKLKTAKFCAEHRIRYPRTYVRTADALVAVERGELSFPLILKPTCGQGSIELYRVKDKDELRYLYQYVSKRIQHYCSNGLLSSDSDSPILIQEIIRGTEYGLDVVHDLDGRFAACFVKRKLAMRAGETDVAETVTSPIHEEYGRMVGENLGHIGILDVDVIEDEKGLCLLEMNPRFGGHYPFSHMAGADIPSAILAWAENRMPDPNWLRVKPGVRSAKDISMVSLSA